MSGGAPQRPCSLETESPRAVTESRTRGSKSTGSQYQVPEGDSVENSGAWLGQKGSETAMGPRGSKIQSEESHTCRELGYSIWSMQQCGAQEGSIETLGGDRGMDWWYLTTIS